MCIYCVILYLSPCMPRRLNFELILFANLTVSEMFLTLDLIYVFSLYM